MRNNISDEKYFMFSYIASNVTEGWISAVWFIFSIVFIVLSFVQKYLDVRRSKLVKEMEKYEK